MQVFENSIRSKGDYILDQIQQIQRMTKDRNLFFFLKEIADTITEIQYTSDEWFTNINLMNDKTLNLSQKVRKLVDVNRDYSNTLDEYEDYLSSQSKRK